MDTTVELPELALRFTLACVFGGILGFEREVKNKPAGLRTYILVALGAACFTVIAFELFDALERDAGLDVTRVDPMRIVEGIATGIGFLGAGAILTSQGSVQGLTTAGGIWLTGAIGVACGGGHYAIASLATAFGLFALVVLQKLEESLRRRGHLADEDGERGT